MNDKMILIPEWQYCKMLESYDNAVKELEKLKNALEEAATSSKAQITRQCKQKPDLS